MSDDQQQPPKLSAWPLAIVLLVLMLAYVLSYAPVVRLMGGFRTVTTVDLIGRPAVCTFLVPIYGDDLPV